MNAGPQDGRRRQNYRARAAAPPLGKLIRSLISSASNYYIMLYKDFNDNPVGYFLRYIVSVQKIFFLQKQNDQAFSCFTYMIGVFVSDSVGKNAND